MIALNFCRACICSLQVRPSAIILGRHARAYMRRPLSRTFWTPSKKVLEPGGCGNSAALMTRQTLATGQDRYSSPKAACGAPRAQGLMNGPARSIMRSCRLSHTVPRVCWHRKGIQGGAHAHVRFHIAQTYIRSGIPLYQAPSCVFARVKGSKGMGPILNRGVFQPSPRTVTHPPWIAVFLLRRLRLLSLL